MSIFDLELFLSMMAPVSDDDDDVHPQKTTFVDEEAMAIKEIAAGTCFFRPKTIFYNYLFDHAYFVVRYCRSAEFSPRGPATEHAGQQQYHFSH